MLRLIVRGSSDNKGVPYGPWGQIFKDSLLGRYSGDPTDAVQDALLRLEAAADKAGTPCPQLTAKAALLNRVLPELALPDSERTAYLPPLVLAEQTADLIVTALLLYGRYVRTRMMPPPALHVSPGVHCFQPGQTFACHCR